MDEVQDTTELEYQEFVPPEEDADDVQPLPTGPTRVELLAQIESDHYQMKRQMDQGLRRLTRRHAAVAAAESDEDARAAYDAAVANPES